jgi:virginiamycin B lyase
MPDARSEIRNAFARRLARTPMSPDLPGRVAQHVAGGGQRPPLRFAAAVAVLLAVAVVGTLVYTAESRRPPARPATAPPPSATPSILPTGTPTLATTPSASLRITAYRLPDQNAVVESIAWGPDGALWFTMQGSTGAIGRLDASGAVRELALPQGTANPRGIAIGPDRALWIAAQGTPSSNGVILRLTTDGRFTRYVLASPDSAVQGITAGPDGALWFTEEAANKIGRITTSGAVTEYPLPTGPNAAQCGQRCPLDIVAGPDGALWFTESQFSIGGGNRIGRISTSGMVTEYAVPTQNSLPGRIVRGPDGSLWFTEDRGARVGRVTADGRVTELPVPGQAAGGTTQAVAAGSDGAVWVVGAPARADLSSPVDRLYRIAPDGTIAEHRLPGSGTAITAGAAGTLWVAGQGQIWKVEL